MHLESMQEAASKMFLWEYLSVLNQGREIAKKQPSKSNSVGQQRHLHLLLNSYWCFFFLLSSTQLVLTASLYATSHSRYQDMLLQEES